MWMKRLRKWYAIWILWGKKRWWSGFFSRYNLSAFSRCRSEMPDFPMRKWIWIESFNWAIIKCSFHSACIYKKTFICLALCFVLCKFCNIFFYFVYIKFKKHSKNMKYKTQWHRTLLLTGPQKWRILICSFPVTDFIHFVEHTVNSFVSFSLSLSLAHTLSQFA